MRTRLVSFSIAICLLLSLIPAQLSAQTAPNDRPFVQGEVAYVLGGDIWLLNLNSGESRQLTDDGVNRWPNWSPHGGQVASGSDDGTVRIWDVSDIAR